MKNASLAARLAQRAYPAMGALFGGLSLNPPKP
ncbi:hypothetical protein A2U01_0050794, partial [Trifolium medium]|nr:hypothetical protein [Trifolium medium]